MADFESVATSLAAKSSECLTQIESIGHRLDEFESALQQSSEQLISQATSLEAVFEDVAQKLAAVESDITERFDTFFSNCSQLEVMITGMRTGFQAQHDALRTSIEACHTAAQASSAEQEVSWQSLQASASSLVEGYSGVQGLSESVTADLTAQVMDELASTLTDLEAKLTSESLELTEAIEDQGLASIVGKSGEIASKIEAVGSQLKDGLQDAGSLAEQSLSGNLESLSGSYEDSVASILEMVSSLSDSFGDALDQIGDSIESVSNTFDVIDDVTDASNTGLRSALKVFEEAKELLERIV